MTVDLIVSGTTYSLDDGTYAYYLGADGLGMAQVNDLSESGPLQHGDTDRGYRLQPRIIRLFLDVMGTSQNDMYDKRTTLLELFNPITRNLKLRYTYTNVRQIDCHYIGDMTMPSNDRDGFTQKVVVTLKANDPTWYNPTGKSHVFTISAGADTFVVPFEVPFKIGSSVVNTSEVLTNAGSFLSYPRIRITGPIADPVITNNTTGEVLSFSGATIAGAEWIELDLRYGYKTVVDHLGANQIALLTTGSDLVSFHLAAAPEAAAGGNSITVTGTGATESTSVWFTWFDRYIGI